MVTVPWSAVLTDVLEYLVRLAKDEAEPPTATVRLTELRERYPDVQLRLVWQREQYDDSLQYDVLITPPDMGTISLSYGDQGSLPWPLRGGQRIGERLLLRVDGVEMELDEAIATLDFIWDEARLADRLVSACLIRKELDQTPVELNNTELQSAMDAFRRARGLLTAEETDRWLMRHCLSHRDFEKLVAMEVAVARLRRRVTDDEIASYFDQQRMGLASATIARLVFTSEAEAQKAADEIRGGSDFYLVAESYVSRGLVSNAALFSGVRRDELPMGVAESVFNAASRSTLGPFPLSGGYVLIRLLAKFSAVLDEKTIDLIERRVFEEWLGDRERSAKIEWFWGNSVRVAEIPVGERLSASPWQN